LLRDPELKLRAQRSRHGRHECPQWVLNERIRGQKKPSQSRPAAQEVMDE